MFTSVTMNEREFNDWKNNKERRNNSWPNSTLLLKNLVLKKNDKSKSNLFLSLKWRACLFKILVG